VNQEIKPMRIAHILALILSLSVVTRADDWPHWRGPSSSGVSSERGLPERWSDTENVAWKAPLEGLGISSPIVWGDRVFVTSQVGNGVVRQGPRLMQSGNAADAGERPLGGGATNGDGRVTFLVSAFEKQTGKRVWRFELPGEGPLPSVHDKHNLASPSPATDGERVYAWFATGQLAALDFSGKLVWKTNLGATYGPFEINWGHGSSPTVYGDTLILICYHESQSYLLALDARTGRVRWKVDAERGTISYSTPLVVEVGGKGEIVVNSSAGVSGHDLATGARLWHIEESNRFPIPMPLFDNGLIFTSRGYRSSPFMAVRPGGRGNVAGTHVVWRAPSGGPYVSSLVHYQGLIYMVGDVGVLTVTDAATGARTHQERIGGVYSASPVAGDGKVFLLSEDGETTVVSAGRTPRTLARNRLAARQLASPAVSGGRLFIRSDNTLFAVGK
jgi:outer membrane protein assembly factor BamB